MFNEYENYGDPEETTTSTMHIFVSPRLPGNDYGM